MRRITTLALAALLFATTACEDDDGVEMGPGGDVNGTWVVQRSSGTTYLRVLPSTIELFTESDTCFQRTRFGIQAIEGVNFTVVPAEGGNQTQWGIERVDDALLLTINGELLTMEPAAIDVNTLQVCGGPDPDFPHPGCTNLPQLEVGGTAATSELSEGDARWSDDTWYELWGFQLDAAASVTINQVSDDQDLMDPYLLLYDEFGATRIDENDDVDFDGGNYNSRIGPIDLDAGCYIIVAGTWMGDDEGEVGGGYSVSVQ